MIKQTLGSLRVFLDEIGNVPFTREIVVTLLRYARMLIEDGDSAESYSTLNMYSHLVVHSELDRNAAGLKLLSDINVSLIENRARYGMNEAINRAFRLDLFRRELIKLLKEHALESDGFEYRAGWIAFLAYYFEEIRNRRIRFSDDIERRKAGDAQKKVFDKMAAAFRAVSDHAGWEKAYIPTSLHFTHQSGFSQTVIPGLKWVVRYHQVPFANANTYCWLPVTMTGGVGIMEERTSFLRDIIKSSTSGPPAAA